MKPKVIVYSRVPDEVLTRIKKECDVTYYEKLTNDNYSDFMKELTEAEGVLGSGLKVDKQLLEKAKRLKVVSNITVGYDNLAIDELTARGVLATNTPTVLDDTVADTMMALILTTRRRVVELDQLVKNGEWKDSIAEEHFGLDVHHKKLGIIGMGRVGQTLAKRAYAGFDMEILYHNRSRNEWAEDTLQAKYCSLEELLEQSDVVCLLTPLTKETEGLMGNQQFELMKSSAVFINGSRGATVDEQALIHALEEGKIYAAGLDVYKEEPVPVDHPLLSMRNVVSLPHIGSATHETRHNMAQLAADNLLAALNGASPPTPINEKDLS
ncbi:2-hydroxyacid dehydrogenase [Alkalicoccobacillus porphyridii]|uniref:Glyoxylate/hydroxypyruvate reductase B n=1 Tax=Alkalicoccobacillus porphyridii TaxID=2597270 RepID=A0A554A391_9BACI|nr:D-glycerate dehydrogenase [Alkalicoccobacillus porphyridii]TSB48159.1 D-glycerate dehydrogenase [Alkalicoccobacillus porphyridii]